ncbi:methyltransferase domain-containing protein [Xylariaceae sp. FL0594]|nr:methyltransferase domain-containing protein [Xylariaceae sp. FL0594]
MSELTFLPANTYEPPSPSLARRPGRTLNTIMEEEPEEPQRGRPAQMQRRNQAHPSTEKIVQWLSPRSDHFPTPRGFHFMSAPILPDSPSTASFDESNSPSSSANPWNRASVSTDVTEFDDIYDVSDDEDSHRKTMSFSQTHQGISRASHKRHTSTDSSASHRSLPRLTIPAGQATTMESWSGRPDLWKLASPVPPTPTTKVEMSPAVMSYLQSQQALEVPAISAPPSLDGSLTSDQMATLSAPATPVLGADEEVPTGDWAGVQLQPAALATLQALAGGDVTEEEYQPERVMEVSEDRVPEMTQHTSHLFTPMSRPSLRLSTQRQQPAHGLTRLDIPSPGGFFSGLSPRTRHTWHLPTTTPYDVAPPTSTTAEQFYRCPWRELAPPVPPVPALPRPPPPPRRWERESDTVSPSAPVEQIIEFRGTMSDGMLTAKPIIVEQVVEAKNTISDDPVTARRIVEHRSPPTSPVSGAEPVSPVEGLVATEIVTVYDPEYAKKQQQVALSNLDRTELWLMAQKAYLQGCHIEDVTEPEEQTIEIHLESEPKEEVEPEEESPVSQRKKAVRFSEVVVQTNIPRSLPPRFSRKESAYYRAFQDFIIRSRPQDTFVHRLPRFEAVQAQRTSLREAHRNQLLGKYQLSVVPQSAKKRMSANVVRGDDVIIDDPERLKREREDEALKQMATANWHVSAIKALNGGRLFSAPIANRLARLSRIAGASSRVRILDLGGQATCDWAWHCAMAYPSTKVYTVTTKAVRQLSNCNMRGPPNHRQVAVERLTRLPFPDDHFDLVSARELQSILKFIGENGEDEWETCMSEVMRVLKPNGYFDFSVLDSDIMNAGPLGLAKSVEFGFSLKTLGYDPNPTRLFLGRVARAGFKDVRRVWLCLPMGPAKKPAGSINNNEKPLPVLRDSKGIAVNLDELEKKKKGMTSDPGALVEGSTEHAGSISGLAGGWAWERWLLRAEMEKVAGEGRLLYLDASEVREAGKCLEGINDVVEEGRACGAGYRVLNGFARKPAV